MIALARRMTALDPGGLAPWKRLGDVLWDAGRIDEARAAYERTLQVDADFELDPLKRLGENERRLIEQRLDEPMSAGEGSES